MACEATPADSFSALSPPGTARNDLAARDTPIWRVLFLVALSFGADILSALGVWHG